MQVQVMDKPQEAPQASGRSDLFSAASTTISKENTWWKQMPATTAPRAYQETTGGAFFPSVSVGWKMSSENFMKNISWLDELKLRGSLGKLGNQEIGFYPYQDILNLTNYAFICSWV